MEVLKQLHTSVAQDFERLFDDAYQTLHTELARRDGQMRDAEERARLAIQARRDIASEVLKLRRENSLLREENRRIDVGQEDIEGLEKLAQLKDQYSPKHLLWVFEIGEREDGCFTEDKMKAVWDKYVALYEDFQTLFNASRDLKEKIKRHKKKLHYWRGLLDQEEFALVLDEGAVKFKRVQDATADNSVPPSTIESAPFAIDPLVEVDHESAAGRLSPTSSSRTSKVSGEASSTHTTDPLPNAIPVEPASTQSEPSTDSDETVLTPRLPEHLTSLEAQTLKRKREAMLEPSATRSDNRDLPADNPLQQPILIKSESMSSSPLRSLRENHGPVGTQDLDEIGSAVETPTKRKSHNANFQPQVFSSETVKSPPPHQYRHRTEPIQRPPKRRTVLQPVDSNLRAVNDPNAWAEQKPAKSLARSSRYAIGSLAEDGDESLRPAPRKGSGQKTSGIQLAQSNPSMDKLLTQKRLDNLLEQPLPPRRPLDIQKKIGSIANAEANPGHTCSKSHAVGSQRGTSNLSRDKSTAPGIEQMESEAAQQENSRWESVIAPDTAEQHPEDEPYRARPLHRLDLRHFKINPENNQGLDFAYDAVVRRKDERKCVNGCTRPGCCREKFLAMARLGGNLANLEGSCQEEKEQKILEEYLGKEKYLLSQLTAEDRQSLLHEARARSMANIYGKHRHDHQRPSTPPGFWRSDMPTTQELERDREEAMNLEREKVKERYREAMRGGLWKFADE